jgi:hypothetical protein
MESIQARAKEKLYLDFDEVLLNCGVGGQAPPGRGRAPPGLQMRRSRPRLGVPTVGRPLEDADGVPELARGGDLAGG